MTLCLYLALRKDNDFSVNIDKIKVMMFKILALRIRILGREKGSIPMILYIPGTNKIRILHCKHQPQMSDSM